MRRPPGCQPCPVHSQQQLGAGEEEDAGEEEQHGLKALDCRVEPGGKQHVQAQQGGAAGSRGCTRSTRLPLFSAVPP